MAYYRFKDEDGNESGSFEVFHIARGDDDFKDEDGAPLAAGWYYWACFPGCMPDGAPMGPFKSEEAAVRDAQGEVA